MKVENSLHFGWEENSTYIHRPPFFDGAEKDAKKLEAVKDAHILALFGDSITTDHISPAGNISINSPAARFLKEKGI